MCIESISSGFFPDDSDILAPRSEGRRYPVPHRWREDMKPDGANLLSGGVPRFTRHAGNKRDALGALDSAEQYRRSMRLLAVSG